MEQDLANRQIAPLLQHFSLPKIYGCSRQCVQAHYRGGATMCCFPTNLTFFPLMSKANVAQSYKHAD